MKQFVNENTIKPKGLFIKFMAGVTILGSICYVIYFYAKELENQAILEILSGFIPVGFIVVALFIAFLLFLKAISFVLHFLQKLTK